MASKTISQRITLEGSDDIKKQLEALGKAGEDSFKQIQDAAQNTKIDPARVDDTKQAFDRLGTAGAALGTQFKALAESVVSFGSQGTKSALDVATGLQKTAAAAQQVGSAIGQASQQIGASGESASAKLISTATAFKLAAAGVVAATAAIASSLTKGAVETGTKIADQAEKLKLTTAQWLELRKAAADAGVSTDDFQKSMSKIVGLAGDADGGIAKVVSRLNSVTEQAFKMADGNVIVVKSFGTNLKALTGTANEAASQLRSMGVSMATIGSGNTVAIMREAAVAINNMQVGQAAAGVKAFGDNWKETVKVLLAGKTATVEQAKSLAEVGKASRDMTAEQVDTAKKVKAAWEDLGAAVRATKDQIGAVFLGGALTQTEWLTKLVDGSRELLRIWLGLSDQKQATFVAGLGDSAAETAFKVLIAVGQQLAGIWRDVLVPAGAALLSIVGQIAANFEGVTKSQVAAFFITAAAAAVALAVAFKGIGLVLSPFTALISLFASFGPILIPLVALVVLFWDQISAGAAKAAALIPESLAQIVESFKLLFAGDFAGFWTQFSAAAVTAFQTISQAAAKTPWVQSLIDGFKTIGQQIPGTIKLIGEALISLGNAATGVANTINKLFGTELTGTDIVALVVIGQMTGALQALSAIATTVGVAFAIMVGTFSVIASIGGAGAAGIAAIVVAITALLAILAVLRDYAIADKEAIIAAFAEMAQAVAAAVTTAADGAWQWIVDTFNNVVGLLGSAISQATALITTWVTTPVANAWQWIKDSFDSVINSIRSSIDQATSVITGWVSRMKEMISSVMGAIGFGGGGSASSGGGGFAGGGLLGGRGSGTSDSNLAWVSRGEYITPARAVAQPGVLDFLEALRRSGGNLRDVLDGMGRFALGGLVHAPMSIPAFAGGGMNHVTIQFPGLPAITGLRASSDVVEELRRSAALAQVRSGGRKPSRFS
jgi:hypothetical protein